MADFASVAAVSSSITRFLNFCFNDQQPIAPGATDSNETTAILARTEDLDIETSILLSPPCLSVFLYRIDFNRTNRASIAGMAQAKGKAYLPLEFHYLLIPWAGTAEQEYRILGRTMQCLEDNPILTGPMLDPITNWSANDSIQVYMEELKTEDLMRIFDSLPVDYKLCIPYMAKVLVMHGRRQELLNEVGTHSSLLTSAVELGGGSS